MAAPVPVLMIGTGEYTTGFGKSSAQTDKGAGVVAITMFDLRRRGLVGDIGLCGTNGPKLPAVRAHLKRVIADAYPRHGFDVSCRTWPADDVVDPRAYEPALVALPRGAAVIVFTPDSTHFEIALAAVRAGAHVLVTKPLVQTLAQHRALVAAAAEARVLLAIELHKRFDPIYVDARDRIRALGDMTFVHAYMSQPKLQLLTFAGHAGRAAGAGADDAAGAAGGESWGNDNSYYLNAHHVDFIVWCMSSRARPVRVTAAASTGVAVALLGRPVEDAITLTVEWENLPSRTRGVGVFTASWVAPKSDVHSQQRFFWQGHAGEVTVDQAHRGYAVASDAAGFQSLNPLFMKYTPSDGRFAGQMGYGYRSLEAFVRAVADVSAGRATVADFDESLATARTTLLTTAVLEAGRRSLDARGAPVAIAYATSEVPADGASLPSTLFEPVDLALSGALV